MARLAEAEKKLDQAIAALESALTAIPLNASAVSSAPNIPAPDNSALLADIAAIDDKIEQAMKLVAKASSKSSAPSGDQT